MQFQSILFYFIALIGTAVIPFYNVSYFTDYFQSHPDGTLFSALIHWANILLRSNPLAKNITLEILCLLVPAALAIKFESSRSGIKRGWVYVVIGYLGAICIALPLLLARVSNVDLSKLERSSKKGVDNILLFVFMAFHFLLLFILSGGYLQDNPQIWQILFVVFFNVVPIPLLISATCTDIVTFKN